MSLAFHSLMSVFLTLSLSFIIKVSRDTTFSIWCFVSVLITLSIKSIYSKVDICVGHCLRDVGRFIASHKISPEEAALLISRYCAAQGRGLSWGAKPSFPWNGSTFSEAPLPTCSCCGVRTFHIDNSDTKDDESDKDVIEGMGLRGEAFGSTRRTYQEVEVDQELINKTYVD